MDIYELPDVTTALQSGDVLVLCREVSPGVWTTYQIDAVNLNGQNLSNTDLTFTATRNHDTNGFDFEMTTDGGTYAESWYSFRTAYNSLGYGLNYRNYTNTEIADYINNVKILSQLSTGLNILVCPTYADDTAAGAGGLTTGAVYKTATGELRIKL